MPYTGPPSCPFTANRVRRMMSFRVLRSFAIVLSATLAFGCADSPTAPPAPSAAIAVDVDQDQLLGGLLGGILKTLTRVVQGVIYPNGIEVSPVRWASGHSVQTRSVSGTIGRWGGTLAIPGSDFMITFPAGALSSNTKIVITSDASGYVSYDMQPHGIRFAKPVIVTQRLRNTAAYTMPRDTKLFGAYLGEDSPGLIGGLLNTVVKALEIVTSVTLVRPDGKLELQTWSLKHFSRYILASG